MVPRIECRETRSTPEWPHSRVGKVGNREPTHEPSLEKRVEALEANMREFEEKAEIVCGAELNLTKGSEQKLLLFGREFRYEANLE